MTFVYYCIECKKVVGESKQGKKGICKIGILGYCCFTSPREELIKKRGV